MSNTPKLETQFDPIEKKRYVTNIDEWHWHFAGQMMAAIISSPDARGVEIEWAARHAMECAEALVEHLMVEGELCQ